MSKQLFERLKRAERLPTPPAVALRVLDLVRKEDVSFRELAEVIGADPALTLKLLRFVNSPAAGLPRQVAALQQAVPLIGLRGVKMMALSFSLLSTERRAACAGFDFDRFWSQSLACGVSSRAIARETAAHDSDEAFMAGLLAKIGKLVLACAVPDEYAGVLRRFRETGRELLDIEQEVLGGTHTALGAALLADWQLPPALCQAVAGHRRLDSTVPHAADAPLPVLIRLVYAAHLIARLICERREHDAAQVAHVAATVAELFSIRDRAWERLFSTIAAEWQAFGNVLSIQTEAVQSFAEIQAEAQERMAELSLATQLENREIQAKNEELNRKVLQDRLTGIHNRAAFDELWPLEIERAIRGARPLAVLMIDVDHFKRFNDTFGHAAGDVVLQAVARTLVGRCRKIDFVARYGGEEFIVVAPETNAEQVAVVGERLRAAIAALRVEHEGQSLSVTASIGGAACERALLRPAVHELLKRADEQLYAAKRAGRNRCHVTDPAKPEPMAPPEAHAVARAAFTPARAQDCRESVRGAQPQTDRGGRPVTIQG